MKPYFDIVIIGVTRFVILIGNYAIKFPKPVVWNHFLRGLLSNMDEKIIWTIACIPNNTLTETKKYLCPVVWSSWGGWILVMKRVEPVNRETWNPIETLYKVCGDHKPENYGMLDGRMVMIDYPGYNTQQYLNSSK